MSVQLIDTKTAQAIWAAQYDQNMKDILQVQGQVASQIARALQARVSEEDRRQLLRQSTSSPAAYALYLKASTMKSGRPKLAMLQEAVKLDPKFSVAYAGMSRVQGELGAFGDRRYYDDPLAAARKAIETNPDEARGHHALATIELRLGKIRNARLGYLRALELAPSFADAAWDLSIADSMLGRLDESLFWARRGFRTSAPNISTAYYHVAVPLLLLSDRGAAERWLRNAEQRFPGVLRIQYMLADLAFLAGSENAADARVRRAHVVSPENTELQVAVAGYAFLMQAPDAEARITELFAQSPAAATFLLPETFRTLHAYHLFKRGDTARATALWDEAMGAARKELEAGNEGPDVPLEMAAIYAVKRDHDEALRWIDEAYKAGDRHFREIRRDPFFAALRSDREFVRILQRMEDNVAEMRLTRGRQ